MRFLEVTPCNFLSFGPPMIIRLDGRGLVAVLGQNVDSGNADSNGAGKSSIMEAIVWSLWGVTLRGLGGDDVVNRSVGKDCRVHLTLEDGGQEYQIVRTRADSSSRKPNDLLLYVNGKSVTAGINSDTQAQINTIIGMDIKTFTQSVLLSHGERSFSEMTDREQKLVLEDILQIDTFAKAQAVAKRRIADKQNLLAMSEGELSSIQNQHDTTTARLQDLAKLQTEHDQSLQARQLKLMREKAAVEAQSEGLYKADGLDKLIDTARDIDEARTSLGKEDDLIQGKILNLTRRQAQERSTAQQAQAKAEGQQQILRRHAHTVSGLAGKACPTCQQVMDPLHADAVLQSADAELQKLDQVVLESTTKINKIDDYEKRESTKLAQKRAAVSAEAIQLNNQLLMVQEKIQKRSATLQLICQLEQQVFVIEQQIAQLEEEENPYTKLVDEAALLLEELQQQKNRLLYRTRALSLEIDHLQFWERGFSNQGLKSYVIDGVVPFLNERAQYYADIMSGGDLQITFSTQKQLKSGQWREEFQVQVVNRQGADVYKGNSAGEKRRSDIAVGWALGDLAATRAKKPIRFKGLDEPFENLDETGEDAVIKLLHTVLPQYETILCITHSSHLQTQFQQVLTVVKENGFTRVT